MSSNIVDLRSDTVTTPTEEMMEAMMCAKVGDDVLGDDPTVARLEEIAAMHTGHETAVFVPSGTMGNQIALASHTNPGDSIVAEDEAHILYYEVGAPAVLNGLLTRTVQTERGIMDAESIEKRLLQPSLHTPGTSLICLENSHNRAGGSVTTVESHREIRALADSHRLPIHLDGARVFNAAVALGVEVSQITDQVDSVSFCLSKALGAPVGSVLTGSMDFIEKARIWRKRLGGGMRQAGILAAAGIYALDNHIDKLADDHRRTKELYEALNGLPGLDPTKPETNILMVNCDLPAENWIKALEEDGIRAFAMDPHRMRFVFHHQVTDEGLEQAKVVFRRIAVEFA